MTLFKNFFVFLISMLVLVACSKEKSLEGKDFLSDQETLWEFTEAGTLYNGKMDSAGTEAITGGLQVLTAVGSESTGEAKESEIILQMAGPQIVVGEYRNPDIFFQYSEDGAVLFQNSPLDGLAFTLVITGTVGDTISGTFSGQAKDAEGNIRNIEDGRFKVKLGGSTAPPTGPDPNLDYLPLHTVWTYGNVDDFDNDTLAINSVGDTLADGKTYRKFLNSATGKSRYFRKEGGVYYEYMTDFAGFPLTPPTEQAILMDDAADNSWETDPYEFTFGTGGSGPLVTVHAKIKRKITGYNFSATINGVLYHNLIEVLTEMYVKEPGDTDFEESGTYYSTVFAKGVGIVSYVELSTETVWNIRHYITHD